MTRFSVFLAFALLCASCTARINGSLMGDGQADLQIQAALEPRITRLIGALAAASGAAQPGASILDGPAIAASMARAPGIDSVSFANTAPTAIEGPVKITRIGDFLASRSTGGFIRFQQNFPAGGRCIVDLNLKSGPQMLAFISPDVVAYLSALMAPLATGEAMSKQEYLELTGSIYGKGIADEIEGARLHINIDFPGPVQSVKGGTFSGSRAEFAIPLADILVLEKPLSYEVVWK
ncbi:MAG: hypothetical protein LBG95_04335 [Treponema sp.]|jgi:hypothetical protein|nr:hypothetical protein [Treponema sp.]